METYQIAYEDIDGETCTTTYKYKSVADFIRMCELYGIRIDTFTNIRLVKE